MKRFLVIIAAFIAATAALGQGGPPAPAMESVTVNGTGRTSLTPDRFTFTVGVQTVAPTVEDAVAENNQRLQSVIAALTKPFHMEELLELIEVLLADDWHEQVSIDKKLH